VIETKGSALEIKCYTRDYLVLNLTPYLCKYFININNVLYKIVALNFNFLLLLVICFQINLF